MRRQACPSSDAELDRRVKEFFAPPTAPVKPLFVTAYLAAQFFLFLALMGPDDSASQVSAISMITGLGALGAVFANVIFGQISDRTTWAWGRRRPWLVIGVLLMGIGLSIMGLGSTVPVVAIGWLLGQIGANAALAPFVAVMSDQVPEFQRARVSSWIAIAQNISVLAATYLSEALADNLRVLFIAPAIPAILVMVWFAFVLPDKQMPVRLPRLTLKGFLETFWVNPVAHPDYALAWWGRFLIIFASFSFTTYRLMFLVHRVDLTQAEAGHVITISVLIYTIVSMVASFIGGWLSDQFKHRKVFVFLASALFGVGTALLAHTTTVGMFYAVEAVMGLAYGISVAVDLALVVDVLPDPEHSCKDLGVFSIANALPQSLAPYLAPVFLGIGSADKTNYPALCYVAGACAIVGGAIIMFVRKVK